MAAADIEDGFIAAKMEAAKNAVALAEFAEITAVEHQRCATETTEADIERGLAEAVKPVQMQNEAASGGEPSREKEYQASD